MFWRIVQLLEAVAEELEWRRRERVWRRSMVAEHLAAQQAREREREAMQREWDAAVARDRAAQAEAARKVVDKVRLPE